MNGIDELLQDFAAVPEGAEAEARIAEQVARRRLRRAIEDAKPKPRRRWRRLGVPTAVAGGLAAVILAIVALLPAHDANAPAPASAAVVLERAAQVATIRPAEPYPGPHQYLYLKFREGWTTWGSQNGSGFAYRTIDTQQDWVAPNGSGRQRLIYDGPPQFLTARDRAAWMAAGRPEIAVPSLDGTYPAGGYPAGNQVDPAGLPTQPRELLRAIVDRFERGKFDPVRTFEAVSTLLQDSGSPALRAALYRMVADMHGVQLLGRQVDPLGRSGVMVGVVGGGVREELLFDPATSDVLEAADVQVSDRAMHLPAGTVMHYFAYEGRGVVDSIEALPGGGKVRFNAGRR
jgi:hypothetical protein